MLVRLVVMVVVVVVVVTVTTDTNLHGHNAGDTISHCREQKEERRMRQTVNG